MRTNSVEALVLLVSVLAFMSLAPMAEAQVAAPNYLVLDTERTGTMQQELQEAANNGYRLVPGQGSWGPTAILEKALDPETIEYFLLATSKTGTLQNEMDEAAPRAIDLPVSSGKATRPSWSCSAHRTRRTRHTSTSYWEPNGLAPWKRNYLRQPRTASVSSGSHAMTVPLPRSSRSSLIFPRWSRSSSDLCGTDPGEVRGQDARPTRCESDSGVSRAFT